MPILQIKGGHLGTKFLVHILKVIGPIRAEQHTSVRLDTWAMLMLVFKLSENDYGF